MERDLKIAPSVLFFACADKKYEDFAPIYIASALSHVANSFVEIALDDADRYIRQNSALVDELRRIFGARFTLRSVNWRKDTGRRIRPNTIRFINQPHHITDYVYIGDIDIIHLDSGFVDAHLGFMAKTGLPYSNSVRPDTSRMSGLHFTKFDALYPLPDISGINIFGRNDEEVLYEVCEKKGLAIQDKEWWRPIHGIHISPNRQPWGSVRNGKARPGWGIQRWEAHYSKFRANPLLSNIWEMLRGGGAVAVQVIDEFIREGKPGPNRKSEALARFLEIFPKKPGTQ